MLPCLPDLLGCAVFLSVATLEFTGALAAGCTLVGLLAPALLWPVVKPSVGSTAAAAAAGLVAPGPVLLGSSAVAAAGRYAASGLLTGPLLAVLASLAAKLLLLPAGSLTASRLRTAGAAGERPDLVAVAAGAGVCVLAVLTGVVGCLERQGVERCMGLGCNADVQL